MSFLYFDVLNESAVRLVFVLKLAFTVTLRERLNWTFQVKRLRCYKSQQANPMRQHCVVAGGGNDFVNNILVFADCTCSIFDSTKRIYHEYLTIKLILNELKMDIYWNCSQFSMKCVNKKLNLPFDYWAISNKCARTKGKCRHIQVSCCIVDLLLFVTCNIFYNSVYNVGSPLCRTSTFWFIQKKKFKKFKFQ